MSNVYVLKKEIQKFFFFRSTPPPQTPKNFDWSKKIIIQKWKSLGLQNMISYPNKTYIGIYWPSAQVWLGVCSLNCTWICHLSVLVFEGPSTTLLTLRLDFKNTIFISLKYENKGLVSLPSRINMYYTLLQ